MDDDDNAAAWAALELEQYQQFILSTDPDYLAWLDWLNYQAELERVQLCLPLNFHPH